MNLTKEQKDIIASTGNIKINAVAGSGKTTTVIEYAATRPAGSRILYLAFNKSVKQEAIRKFASRGLSNVTVETAHSLAFRHIVSRSRYKVRSQGYKTHEFVELLKLPGSGEKHAEYIAANHINKFMDELEDYIEKTEDVQLGMMLSIVREYGEEIPEIINDIKRMHVSDHEREKAELIFSTVHRSKGMEYDTVRLVNDFITEEKLKKLTEDDAILDEASVEKLNEEINMLYVAVTRAKSALYIPAGLAPADAICFDPIHVADDEEWYNSISPPKKPAKDKAHSVNEIRKKHANAYKPWTEELDDELTVMYCEGVNIKEMAKHFGRNQGAIMKRIEKLELEEKYG